VVVTYGLFTCLQHKNPFAVMATAVSASHWLVGWQQHYFSRVFAYTRSVAGVARRIPAFSQVLVRGYLHGSSRTSAWFLASEVFQLLAAFAKKTKQVVALALFLVGLAASIEGSFCLTRPTRHH
jgi:hypothetical protein